MIAGMPTVLTPSHTVESRGPLRDLRRRRMLTQQDLADLSGLHRSTIIRLEQEPESAYMQTIIKLAAALSMDPYELRDLFETPDA